MHQSVLVFTHQSLSRAMKSWERASSFAKHQIEISVYHRWIYRQLRRAWQSLRDAVKRRAGYTGDSCLRHMQNYMASRALATWESRAEQLAQHRWWTELAIDSLLHRQEKKALNTWREEAERREQVQSLLTGALKRFSLRIVSSINRRKQLKK